MPFKLSWASRSIWAPAERSFSSIFS